MRCLRSLFVLAFAFVLAGCFQIASIITVRPDGSALLTDRVDVSGMGTLALAGSDEKAGGMDKAHFQSRAAALGEGVTLISLEQRETGFTAVYAVRDIRQFRYTPPDLPLSEGEEVQTRADESLELTFEFDDGDPSTLRVLVPEEITEGAEGLEDEAGGPMTDAELQETRRGLEIARSLLGDARMTVEVSVEGDIVDTDAAYVEESTLTVYDLHFDALFDVMAENPELMRGDAPPTDQMRSLLVGREGVQIEEPGIVNVRFK